MNDFKQQYALGHNDLGIFVDESGDTTLRDPANRLFVLGCAMIVGRDLPLLKTKWEMVRTSILGGNSPLHMREHLPMVVKDKDNTLNTFFDYADIGRLAVSFVQEGEFDLRGPGTNIVLKAVFDELLARQAEICSRVYINSLTVIFEDSPLMERISELRSGLTLMESGRSVSLNFVHLTKKAADPNLEMADVIAHTMSGYVRRKENLGHFQGRFDAIFAPKNGAPGLARELKGTFSTQSK